MTQIRIGLHLLIRASFGSLTYVGTSRKSGKTGQYMHIYAILKTHVSMIPDRMKLSYLYMCQAWSSMI